MPELGSVAARAPRPVEREATASAAEAVRMLGASYWLTRPSISPSVYLPLCFAPALYPRPLERH